MKYVVSTNATQSYLQHKFIFQVFFAPMGVCGLCVNNANYFY